MASSALLMKPHHFVDIVADCGAGGVTLEPHPYGHAVHTVTARLFADRDTLLQIELGADAICAPCTHNCDGICDDTLSPSLGPSVPHLKRELNLRLDERWCERLDLKQGDTLTARELSELIADHGWDVQAIYRDLSPEIGEDKARTLEVGVARYLGRE